MSRLRRALLYLVGFMPVWLPAQQAVEPVLTRCEAVRALTWQEAAQSHPVKIRGVVTLLPESDSSFTVDDGTGIWVHLGQTGKDFSRPTDMRPGVRVEVEGHSHQGLFAPMIEALRVRVLGQGSLPAPQAVTAFGLASGALDCQRVRLSGVVQVAELSTIKRQTELRLTIAALEGRFTFVLRDRLPVAPTELVDREVTVTGVCQAAFNSRRQFLGYRIFSNSPEDIIVHPGENKSLFDVPLVALNQILAFSPTGPNFHRQRVRGVVTHSRTGSFFYMEDGKNALRVNTQQGDPLWPGDVVEASGFFYRRNHKAEMVGAEFRRVGHGEPPVAQKISVAEVLSSRLRNIYSPGHDYDDRLVELTGTLVNVGSVSKEFPLLTIKSGEVFVPLEIDPKGDAAELLSLRPGSELQVTGICNLAYPSGQGSVDLAGASATSLLVRSAADVTVIRKATWWTLPRLWTALSLTVGALLVFMAWSVLLRRKVEAKGSELAAEIRARRDAEVDYESTLRERNRLAADLHDTTEQALTGLAFQLETGQTLQIEDGERSAYHLSLARQLLDRSREDLRRSIWNLRANPLDQGTFVEALQHVAEDRSLGMKVRISVTAEGEVRPLDEYMAGNLLLFIQEAITNALKHAQATEIVLKLVYAPGVTELSVADNGQGFDPTTAAGMKQGHFGLQGMRERIKRLGGILEVRSMPGAGAVVKAMIPG